LAAAGDDTYLFRIYVAGQSLRSQRAVANLRTLCQAALVDQFSVEVIDVLDDPDRAELDRVIATPTVIRLTPPPIRRVIGDLSDHVVAARALGLEEPNNSSPEKGRK
jgi:circadian clock protein KaiB